MSQSQLEQRIEIYEEALEKIVPIDLTSYIGQSIEYSWTSEEYSEVLRQRLWDFSNETRQTPEARIARKALKEASLVWIKNG